MDMTEDNLRQALSDYWAATNHRDFHWAYVRMLRAGAQPSYGESPEEAKKLMNCPDCPPWNPPNWLRGFGI